MPARRRDVVGGMQIEVWSDIACPWCYIGKRRLAAALAASEHADGVTVRWRSFQLDPAAEPSSVRRTERDVLVRSKGLDPATVEEMFAHVAGVARDVGLRYDFDAVVPANTFDAHRLVHIARDLGGPAAEDAVTERLMSAHFERGLAVDDVDVLVAEAAACGLDPDTVRAALDRGDGAEAVRADVAEARAVGVTGVPFVVLDRALAVSGAQPSEVFARALAMAHERAASPVR